MDRAEKIARLKSMLEQVAPGQDLEALARERAARRESVEEGLEAFALERIESGDRGIDLGFERAANAKTETGLWQMLDGREDDLDDETLFGLEAIVMAEKRPVVFVRNGTYDAIEDPWTHLNATAIRSRLDALLPSIGRVELPNSPSIPYGGTAFVVGQGLLMTNRHVARLFAEGRGSRDLVYRSGDAAVDFRREYGLTDDDARPVQVRRVVMIHPFWDMALIEVEGPYDDLRPLRLSVRDPGDLAGREVVTVGYPARDDRNDLTVQDRIFRRVYNVKRLQPGQVRARESIQSFENRVNAVTHDSSTLGGNSGSAILDVATGEVVGLHFAGVYLKANYAVPTYELARDRRVVDSGVNFADTLSPTGEWDASWAGLERTDGRTSPAPRVEPAPKPAPAPPADGAATFTIPLRVTVAIGPSAPVTLSAGLQAGQPATAATEAPRMQVPVIFDDLESREGYRPDFLGLLGGATVPLPVLTERGRRAVATLKDGSHELKYHKFSIVMHRRRRMALFTGANVDFRPASRVIDGHRPTRDELTGLDDSTMEQWVTDPRIPDDQQLPDLFFTRDGGHFDKGHLVRRDDVCWGDSFADMQMANGDTFHTTNCSPQVATFNRSAGGVDNWGDLELLIELQTRAERAIVLGGPVLAPDDPIFLGRDLDGPVRVRIPRAFWKVVVVAGAPGLQAFGFLLEQDLSAVPAVEEFTVPPRWRRFMRGIDDIERLLRGLATLDSLKPFDQAGTDEGVALAEAVAIP